MRPEPRDRVRSVRVPVTDQDRAVTAVLRGRGFDLDAQRVGAALRVWHSDPAKCPGSEHFPFIGACACLAGEDERAADEVLRVMAEHGYPVERLA